MWFIVGFLPGPGSHHFYIDDFCSWQWEEKNLSVIRFIRFHIVTGSPSYEWSSQQQKKNVSEDEWQYGFSSLEKILLVQFFSRLSLALIWYCITIQLAQTQTVSNFNSDLISQQNVALLETLMHGYCHINEVIFFFLSWNDSKGQQWENKEKGKKQETKMGIGIVYFIFPSGYKKLHRCSTES